MLTIKQCLPLLALLAQLGAGAAREGETGLAGLVLQQAVPVIHLTEDQYTGKASVDDYLKMFPNELLASNKRVKPIDIRKIEHEDFIDYEIEFIELPAHEENETGTKEFLLKPESSNSNNKIQNDSLNNQDTAKKSEKSKELNLVNFVDLVRKSKTKHNPSRSRAVGDRRRRRRIKLKRDPGRFALQREINDSSNQINTEQTKRDQNNFSETHVFSKPRTIIRNLIQLPETARKSSGLDRRTTVTRVSNFRARKRIPLKSGRSFYLNDKPSDQLIRLRNSEIIAKLERSTFKERNVIRTKGRSDLDDLDDKKSKQTEDETWKQRHVTKIQEDDQQQKTRHILTDGPGVSKRRSHHSESERELSPPFVMSRTTAPLQITTTRSMSIETTSSPLMMYPEVFTSRPQDIPVTEVAGSQVSSLPPTPASVSLLSVFGTEHHSSRLQIVPNREAGGPKLPVFTTVSSALKFSIISTSTQTSVPLLEATTHDEDMSARQPSEQSDAKTSTARSTTISLPTQTTTLGTESEVVSTTTSENWMTEMTDSNPDPTTQQDESKFQEVTTAGDPGSITTDNQMTTTPVPDDLQLSESITSIYLHNSSVKQSVIKDIKTSETLNKETVNSIKMLAYSKPTDEGLVRAMQPPTVTVAPSEREKIFTVTPVSMSVYSTATTTTTTTTTSTTTTSTTTTTSRDGQYFESKPGPYQHDAKGDTAEPYVHDHRANYNHDPTGDTAPPYQHDMAGEIWTPHLEDEEEKEDRYSNLDTTYPGDYEVNEVKVDFDRQDEHKIYNVQAKAGDFIIGEVGRIDINNGQTVEGVRYTALEGEVDPLRIAQILNRFFGARTATQ